MLGRSAFAVRRVAPMGTRSFMNALPKMLYKDVWRKSTRAYLTYIAVGCIVFGAAYEGITESIWRSMNRGVRIEFVC
jgi:hypothetical protein